MGRKNQQKFTIKYSISSLLRSQTDLSSAPSIQIKIPHGGLYNSWQIYQRLLAGQVQASYRNDFREQLPHLLDGTSDSWILRDVIMQDQRLILLYVRRVPLMEEGRRYRHGDDTLNLARLVVTAPLGIVCDFIIPETPNEPKRTVLYHFSRYFASVLHDVATCERKVIETTDDQIDKVIFRDTLQTPFRGLCDPEPEQYDIKNPPPHQ